MADAGLTNAVRELVNAMRGQSGLATKSTEGAVGSHPFLATNSAEGTLPRKWLDDLDGIYKNRNDDFRRITDEHTKGIKKTNDDFFERSAKLNLQLAPVYEALHLYNKYNLQVPAQIMGGAAGRGMRAGLDVSKDAGQMGFDIASAIAATIPGGFMAAMGLQAIGRAGGASVIGDLFFRKGATEAGLTRTYAEDFEAKKWQNEESAMFRARTGRLGAQSGAWGGPNVGSLISGLVGTLNEDPQSLQAMIANAFQIGGTRGIKNIDEATVTKMVQEGYGTAAEVIAAQAAAGRYGYGKGAARDMADRTGLTMDQVLPMMQQTRMQYYMYKSGTAESINKFVANTSMGAMNPSAALSAMASAAQGASAVGDEAASMLQYREFLKANPGSTYLDFVEAKKNGFADEKWRRFVGGASRTFAGMGQTGRLIGAGIGLGPPGQIEGIAGAYAEGLGKDVYRSGGRLVSPDEMFAQVTGRVSAAALESNIGYIGLYVEKFGEKMGVFADEMKNIVKDTGEVVDATILIRKKLAAEIDPLKAILGNNPRRDSTIDVTP